jgi:hypothetical protein
MNTTISLPSTRYLAVIGAAILLAGFFVVARPMLTGGTEAATPVTPPAPTRPAPTPTTRPTPKPTVVLLPGLPPKVANRLRYSKVVVVSLYQGNAGSDRSAVGAAAAGARQAGAGFLPVNVLNEKSARAVQAYVGTTTTPTVVVVRRPGRIVTRLESAASGDQQLVAQAAHNAGASRR